MDFPTVFDEAKHSPFTTIPYFSKAPCQFCQPKCFPPLSTLVFYNNSKACPELFTAPPTKLEVSHNC